MRLFQKLDSLTLFFSLNNRHDFPSFLLTLSSFSPFSSFLFDLNDSLFGVLAKKRVKKKSDHFYLIPEHETSWGSWFCPFFFFFDPCFLFSHQMSKQSERGPANEVERERNTGFSPASPRLWSRVCSWSRCAVVPAAASSSISAKVLIIMVHVYLPLRTRSSNFHNHTWFLLDESPSA